MAVNMSRLSTEFIFVGIQTQDDLSLATAQVAFMEGPSDIPSEQDWEEADLIPADHGYDIRVLVGPFGEDGVDLTPVGSESVDYQQWIRIESDPERPVRRAGLVTIE